MTSTLALRAIRAAIVALAATQLLLYSTLAVRTLSYPYPLEWMEGGSVDVIARVGQGLPLYVQPTAEYVPYIYPPLYYWVSAQVARQLGTDFVAPRLVSCLSAFGVFALIALLVRRNGGDRVLSLAGAALFAGTYEATTRWFHLARVDSLFLFLLLLGAYAWQLPRVWIGSVAAAVIWWLAFLTKQTTLVVIATMLPLMALREPRRAATTGVIFAALVVATNGIMDSRTGGWWSYFLYHVPLMHGAADHGSYWFWRYDMLPALPLALALTAVVCARALAERDGRWYWTAALCAGCLAASWTSRLHSGGGENSLMPVYAALAIAMPIGVEALGPRAWPRTAAAALVALQLALLLRMWSGAVPTTADRAAGDQYVAFLRSIKGEVLIWHQRFVETRAGKRSWGLEMAAEDLLRIPDVAVSGALKADVIRVCLEGQVAGVIDPPDWLREAVSLGPPVEMFPDPKVFRPVAGAPKRPARYYPIERSTSARQASSAAPHQ